MYYWLMKQPPHQMMNMLLHPPKVSKVKEISRKDKNAAPNLVNNQNATKHALLTDERATTSGEEHVASPPKVSKVKEISGKVKTRLHQNRLLKKCNTSKRHMERTKKLHQNWLLIRLPQNMHYWLMKQPPHQVRNMLLLPPKYLKSKIYVERAKKLTPKLVVNQIATKHALLADETCHHIR